MVISRCQQQTAPQLESPEHLHIQAQGGCTPEEHSGAKASAPRKRTGSLLVPGGTVAEGAASSSSQSIAMDLDADLTTCSPAPQPDVTSPPPPPHQEEGRNLVPCRGFFFFLSFLITLRCTVPLSPMMLPSSKRTCIPLPVAEVFGPRYRHTWDHRRQSGE